MEPVRITSRSPRRTNLPKLDVYTDWAVRAWLKFVPEWPDLSIEQCSFAAVSSATPLAWPEPPKPSPIDCSVDPGPLRHLEEPAARLEAELEAERRLEAELLARFGPRPAWLEWELTEGGGWAALLGADGSTVDGFGDWASWALANGIAPGQPFLVEVESPSYPTRRRWGEDYDDSGPAYGGHLVLDRYSWSPEKSRRAWQGYLDSRIRAEAEVVSQRALDAAWARTDRKGWVVTYSEGFSAGGDVSCPPDRMTLAMSWRGRGARKGGRVNLAAWSGPLVALEVALEGLSRACLLEGIFVCPDELKPLLRPRARW